MGQICHRTAFFSANSHRNLGIFIFFGSVRVHQYWKDLYIISSALMLKGDLGFVIDPPRPHCQYIDVIRRNVNSEGKWENGLDTGSIEHEAWSSSCKPRKNLQRYPILIAGYVLTCYLRSIGTLGDGRFCYHFSILVFGYDELPRRLHTNNLHGWPLLRCWNWSTYFRSMGNGSRKYILIHSSFCIWFVT